MQKITTYLWYDNQAERAAELYTSLFDNSRIVNVQRYGDPDPEKAGRVVQAMLQMRKIDIAGLERAYAG